ncbi:translocon at the outer envelope membrane of chloroplasts 75-III [Actinidia rufa]|uniref:Translocon at the outer envelope membrane of chloroplasts 75-III n=1 Tax=Actinidia rufa TaxID=165716 RepID=A0A7J0FSP8_9ERIC|nr:translocon at the outer envelope membrane of chloroplasts 75-III [Actinidia rufa]
MAVPGHHLTLSATPSLHRRRKLPTTTTPRLFSTTVKSSLSSSHSSKNDKPLNLSPPIPHLSLPKTLAFTAASGLLFHLTSSALSFVGNGPGGRGGGDGSGGGGGDGGFWGRLFTPAAAIAQDDDDDSKAEEWDPHGIPAKITLQLNKFSGFKKYKVSEISFYDSRQGSNVGSNDSFFEMVSIRRGGVYTKAQLEKELETLAGCGMFEKVNLEGTTKADGTIGIMISFTESTWQAAETFRCINVGLMPQTKPIEMDPDMTQREQLEFISKQEDEYDKRIRNSRDCLLPPSVEKQVMKMVSRRGEVSARLLQRIRDRVQKWYHDEGYACAQVVNFGNLNTEEVVCEVTEGDITKLVIQFQDKLGNECEGNTKLKVVRRQLPEQLQEGHVFNIEAGKQALRNLNSLALFSNIEVNPKPDEKREGGIIVEIKLKELEQKSAEVSTEWSIVPGRGGRPTLASIQPGGTVSFEHRNLKGLNRSILGSVTTSNFLNPQDDLSFKLEYVHPYLDGVTNARNRTFRASCFNSRKLSPVFTGGPGVDEVPPIWVDRAGVKANITEDFTRQSKIHLRACHGRDNNTQILHVITPSSLMEQSLEGNVFQLDQGLGIGSKFPFFNRHQLTLTRFIQLKQVEEGAGKPPPPVLVLHGHYGGCVGDLPSYDAFTLGGPYSVRGYNMGEIGAARNILELATELRIPVRNTHVYAFAEHGNDLGSSKDVKGNPTAVYRRMGYGSSYGIGVKLGLVRAEYAVDHNSGTGAIFFRFGERF